MRKPSTIVALSSGSLPAGLAVLRISGPRARSVLTTLADPPARPRELVLRELRSPEGETIDTALIAWFQAPHSFTGEDVAELHCHGSRAVVARLLELIVAMPGCRLAEPGEFSRRAFENSKLDLTSAEGIADLIEARTEAQRAQALARMRGGLAEKLESWREALIGLRAEIEARLDFADEGDVGEALPTEFAANTKRIGAEIGEALKGFAGGRLVREGIQVALAGAPNAGKSTLLNALAQSDLAIVTPEPGTTRDIIEAELDIDGYLFVIADLAGMRETDNVVEAEGVRRAAVRLGQSDLVLHLIAPDSGEAALDLPGGVETWRIASKSDLGEPAVPDLLMEISAETGAGMENLREALRRFAERAAGGEAGLVSRARDAEQLGAALKAIERAAGDELSAELVAEELRVASDHLGRLTGRIDVEDVLDRLFGGFCIGK